MSWTQPSPAQAWILLVVAGLLEVIWAVGMKYTDGFTRWLPGSIVLGAAVLSFWLLALAMKALPVGTAYAVWVGIGAVGASVCGVLFFREPATAARMACLLLIVTGVVGLRVVSEH